MIGGSLKTLIFIRMLASTVRNCLSLKYLTFEVYPIQSNPIQSKSVLLQLTSQMTSTPKGASIPGPQSPSSPPSSKTSTSYLSYPVSHVVSGLYRRLTEPSPNRPVMPRLQSHTSDHDSANDTHNGVYTPPHRTASPFQPPPLTPLTLSGSTSSSTILSKAVAEEIRLLLPPRLQLAEQWSLAYSLEQDGVSLGTLYKKCASPEIPRDTSFVLVVQDGAGGVGALPFLSTRNAPLISSTDAKCIVRSSVPT